MPYVEKLYWDSSVWFAWLLDEKRPDEEMQGVVDCMDRVKTNEVLLVTGDIVKLEVVKLGGRYARCRARRCGVGSGDE